MTPHMTIRRALSRVRPTSLAAPLGAAVIGALLCVPADAQDGDQEVYPAPPPGPPPATKVEGADAADEAGMKAYSEAITGTAVTFKLTPIPGGEWFVRQAIAQFRLFTKAEPDEELMRKAFEHAHEAQGART